MGKRGLRFYAVVLLLPIVLGACGGGGGGTVSADAYASDVCNALKSWLSDIQQRASDLSSAVSPGTSPSKGKDLLDSYLNGVISDTDQMLGSVDDAGVPDVPNGSQISDTLTSALDKTKTAFEDARDQVGKLPIDSAQVFADAARQLASSIQGQVGAVGQSLSGIKSDELDTAFNKSDACQNAT